MTERNENAMTLSETDQDQMLQCIRHAAVIRGRMRWLGSRATVGTTIEMINLCTTQTVRLMELLEGAALESGIGVQRIKEAQRG